MWQASNLQVSKLSASCFQARKLIVHELVKVEIGLVLFQIVERTETEDAEFVGVSNHLCH